MNSFLLHVLIALLMLLQVGCGSEPTPPSGSAPDVSANGPTRPIDSGGPVLSFQTQSHDFGDVLDFGSHDVEFPFVNAGTETLQVFEVRPTCGCTTTKLQKKIFAPGEGDTLRLTYSPKSSGRQVKKVMIRSNDPVNPLQSVEISADVTPVIKINPPSFSFGSIDIGDGAIGQISLEAAHPGYTATSVRLGGRLAPHATAALREVQSDEGSPRQWVIDVVIEKDVPWGIQNGSIGLTGALDQEDGTRSRHSRSIQVNGTVSGKLQTSEPTFRLLLLEPDKPFSKRITIKHADGEAFNLFSATVLEARSGNLQVQVLPVADSGGSEYQLLLTGDTTGFTGAIVGKVNVRTDVPGEEEIDIRISGVVMPPEG